MLSLVTSRFLLCGTFLWLRRRTNYKCRFANINALTIQMGTNFCYHRCRPLQLLGIAVWKNFISNNFRQKSYSCPIMQFFWINIERNQFPVCSSVEHRVDYLKFYHKFLGNRMVFILVPILTALWISTKIGFDKKIANKFAKWGTN